MNYGSGYWVSLQLIINYFVLAIKYVLHGPSNYKQTKV